MKNYLKNLFQLSLRVFAKFNVVVVWLVRLTTSANVIQSTLQTPVSGNEGLRPKPRGSQYLDVFTKFLLLICSCLYLHWLGVTFHFVHYFYRSHVFHGIVCRSNLYFTSLHDFDFQPRHFLVSSLFGQILPINNTVQ